MLPSSDALILSLNLSAIPLFIELNSKTRSSFYVLRTKFTSFPSSSKSEWVLTFRKTSGYEISPMEEIIALSDLGLRILFLLLTAVQFSDGVGILLGVVGSTRTTTTSVVIRFFFFGNRFYFLTF